MHFHRASNAWLGLGRAPHKTCTVYDKRESPLERFLSRSSSPLCPPRASLDACAERLCGYTSWVDKMRAESAPELWLPRINNGHGDRTAQPSTAHRAPFSSPVCVPCGKWPKFMIACIWAPDWTVDVIRPSNEMPPCKTTSARCGLECALLLFWPCK